jgi:superfamily I DNA/RNA helicase
VASNLLQPREQKRDDDLVPLLQPLSCGRDGEAPVIIVRPYLSQQLAEVVKVMSDAHSKSGCDWGDMAILCRYNYQVTECTQVLDQNKIPFQVRKGRQPFDPAADGVKVLTLHAIKGLEFRYVALVGVPDARWDETEEAQLFYVRATRATEHLIIAVDNANNLGRLSGALVS